MYDPQTAAHQAPPSLGFSRQEHRSGLPFPSPMQESEKWKWSRSVMSDPQQSHGLQLSRLLHPWDFPGKSTGVRCHCLLPRQYIKKQRHHFGDKGPYSQRYGFSSSHVWMWELDCRECWVLKNWYFWTVLLKRTLESSLDSKKIKSVNPKGNQPWIFTGRTDAEAPILWPPDAKILLQRSSCKDPHWKRLRC